MRRIYMGSIKPEYVVRKVSEYPGANRREVQGVGIKD